MKEESEKSAEPVKNEIPKDDVTKVETTVGADSSKEAKEETPPSGKKYHIIVFSTKNIRLAENEAKDLGNIYSSVTLLPQPNGYYRVSVFASQSKEVALEQLQKVVNEDGRSAWLSHE